MTGAELAAAVRAELEPRRQEMIDLLGRLVRIESPSDDRAGLDRFADESMAADFANWDDTRRTSWTHCPSNQG